MQQSSVGYFDGLNPRHGGLSVESFKETLVYPLTQATDTPLGTRFITIV